MSDVKVHVKSLVEESELACECIGHTIQVYCQNLLELVNTIEWADDLNHMDPDVFDFYSMISREWRQINVNTSYNGVTENKWMLIRMMEDTSLYMTCTLTALYSLP